MRRGTSDRQCRGVIRIAYFHLQLHRERGRRDELERAALGRRKGVHGQRVGAGVQRDQGISDWRQLCSHRWFATRSSPTSQGTLNLIPGTTVSLTAGANGAGTIASSGLAQGPLYQPDPNTVEQRNGTSVQSHYLYGTCTDANNYERLTAKYMPGDGYFELIGQKQGTGGQRGICLGGRATGRWIF